MMEQRAIYIALEGIDGSGKTTLLKDMKEYLLNKKQAVYSFVEPTHSRYGMQFKYPDKERSRDDMLNLLFEDRKLNNEIIKAALPGYDFILADRCFMSTMAYQDIDCEYVFDVYKGFIFPDYILYLDIDPGIALQRIMARENDFDSLKNLQEKKEKYDKAFELLDALNPWTGLSLHKFDAASNDYGKYVFMFLDLIINKLSEKAKHYNSSNPM